MTNLVNVWGENDAMIYSDAATPTLTLENASTSQGVYAYNSSTGAGMKAKGTTGEGAIVENVASGATVAPLRVAASLASQAVLAVSGVFMSTASINVTQAQSAFVIPVYHETEKVWGYISASKGVA